MQLQRLGLFLLTGIAATAAQMTGYISDSACGWNNARPGKEAKECAQKCVKLGGWPPVFVKDGQMEVLKISDKNIVMPYVGEHVRIVGTVKGDTLIVKTVRRTSKGQ
jgi:hypothetical protein